ncbi:hypothetical protein BJ742DRAFT_912225, partial [Cladochytrium replicatum]
HVVNHKGCNLLHGAISRGHNRIVELVLNQAGSEALMLQRSNRGRTPLEIAVLSNHSWFISEHFFQKDPCFIENMLRLREVDGTTAFNQLDLLAQEHLDFFKDNESIAYVWEDSSEKPETMLEDILLLYLSDSEILFRYGNLIACVDGYSVTYDFFACVDGNSVTYDFLEELPNGMWIKQMHSNCSCGPDKSSMLKMLSETTAHAVFPSLDHITLYGSVVILRWIIDSQLVDLSLEVVHDETYPMEEDDNPNDVDVCSVCLRAFGNQTETLPCRHTYHIGCLSQLACNVEAPYTYPLCRSPFSLPLSVVHLRHLLRNLEQTAPPDLKTKHNLDAQIVLLLLEEGILGQSWWTLAENSPSETILLARKRAFVEYVETMLADYVNYLDEPSHDTEQAIWRLLDTEFSKTFDAQSEDIKSLFSDQIRQLCARKIRFYRSTDPAKPAHTGKKNLATSSSPLSDSIFMFSHTVGEYFQAYGEQTAADVVLERVKSAEEIMGWIIECGDSYRFRNTRRFFDLTVFTCVWFQHFEDEESVDGNG